MKCKILSHKQLQKKLGNLSRKTLANFVLALLYVINSQSKVLNKAAKVLRLRKVK